MMSVLNSENLSTTTSDESNVQVGWLKQEDLTIQSLELELLSFVILCSLLPNTFSKSQVDGRS